MFRVLQAPDQSKHIMADARSSATGGKDVNTPFHNYESPLEGDMAGGTNVPASGDDNSRQFNTLDEPVKDTLLRDLKAVGVKFLHVLYPKHKKALLRDWDLWGPLIICIFLAIMLPSNSEDEGLEFAQVFVFVWLGALVVTLNSKLLGGNISFLQCVCVLGYCLLAPAISLIICRLILLSEQSLGLFVLRFVITMAGFGWATFASTAFIGDCHPSNRKALALYPIGLFYFAVSWLILARSS